MGDRAGAPVIAYRFGVRRAVGDAAVPYGFTALVWTSGGVLVSTHGVPTLRPALLFLGGVVLAFTAAALVSADGAPDVAGAELDPRLVGLASGVAAALGLLTSAAVAELSDGSAAYGLVGFCASAVYFLAGGAGLTLIARFAR